jgi:cell division protein FtsL
MSIDLEYAIKRDIRNNPVIREVDERQQHELRRTIVIVALSVGMLLFSAWQHTRIAEINRQIEALRLTRAGDRETNRQLRLNLATLQSPQQIERRARELGMRPALLADTVVVERTAAPLPASGVIAQVH